MSDDDFKADDRASYRRWTREVLRYSDLDPVGHVNNNAYGLFVENARTMLFIHVDDTAEVGLAITRMGNSSMIMRHGVFQGETLACVTLGVSVCFDLDARGSMPIPEEIRKIFWDAAGVAS